MKPTPVKVNFGSEFKNRLARSLDEWLPQTRANLHDIQQHPLTDLHPWKYITTRGIAVAAGPSLQNNIPLLHSSKMAEFVISSADRAATMVNSDLAVTSDPSPLVSEFYRDMMPPRAAVLPIYVHQRTVLMIIKREIQHYYYTPQLQEDDQEFLLLNKVLLDLTGAPLLPGISDSGSLAWRALLGLGCKEIALVGYDYSEPVNRPFESWSLYPTYKSHMESLGMTEKDIRKWASVRTLQNRQTGIEYVTDATWDAYRQRFNMLLDQGTKQGVKTVNCSEGGSIDIVQCMPLKDFLDQ